MVTSPLSKDFTRLLQSHSLLALGDIHGSQKPVELLISLLNYPDFSIQIDDIVVEFGNARFQALADQYVLAGSDVNDKELQKIWRDTLFFMAWQTPQYRRLIDALQRYNKQHSKKIRLVLAEPEFNWQTVTAENWRALTQLREEGYTKRIEQEVVAKQRKAILLFGTFHHIKSPVVLKSQLKLFTSVVARLSARQVQVVSIWPHMGAALPKQYRPPMLLNLADDPYGHTPASSISSRFPDSLQMKDVADYYLYLGEDHRDAEPDMVNRNDLLWRKEMHRRARLIGGRVRTQVESWLKTYPATDNESVAPNLGQID